MPRPPKEDRDRNTGASKVVDLNQIVAYNIRTARELHGWTQEDLAAKIEPLLGTRPTTRTISAVERAWDTDRRRVFDAHEIAIYAAALELPIMWFFLPPPDDRREIRDLGRPLTELYLLLLGRDDQLDPVYDRLRDVGFSDPTPLEEAFERITGEPSEARQWSYRERRKEMLLAALAKHADRLDAITAEYLAFFQRLDQLGIRGFVAAATRDTDYAKRPEHRDGDESE